MVQKSFHKLVQLDNLNVPDGELANVVTPLWKEKVLPSTFLSKQLGNIYCGSLYAGLVSLLHNADLGNKNVMMFSYGSGLAASMFLIRGRGSTAGLATTLRLKERLANRVKVPPLEYDAIMHQREVNFGHLKEGPLNVDFSRLYDGTYYLVSIDKKWKRSYKRYEQRLQSN